VLTPHIEHTLVVSDFHLSEPELPNPKRHPMWKLFKTEKFFIDVDFSNFLSHMSSIIHGPSELVLNGDIFDFDSVMVIPTKDAPFNISLLEKLRGLNSEEQKSAFKMQVILDSHPIFLKALKTFLQKGNYLIFVIGNHDLELHWPEVQAHLLKRLDVSEEEMQRVRFCEWFYISNKDTLIEHGNQYDSFCLCFNPLHPLIKKGSRILLRLPFGDLAARYMINGVGVFNPHTGSFIQDSFAEYLKIYFSYILRIQPFLIWTWLWSAAVTLLVGITEGFLPALKDPLTMDQRIKDIASRAQATDMMVVLLKEMHVHPAIYNPLLILKELWLDRVIFLFAIIFGSFEFLSLVHSFFPFSLWWTAALVILLLPYFIFYARSVSSEIMAAQEAAYDYAPLAAKVTGVSRIVQGHTHLEKHLQIKDVEIINTGTWSPAFMDLACTQAFGKKCFAWIRPDPLNQTRRADLYEWRTNEFTIIKKNILS
jgi:UDP-2,3-diacylglucosamine pyrophosphatase LpxH